MRGWIISLVLTTLSLICTAQPDYPVLKVLSGGDSLVIFAKWQADQLTKNFRVQSEHLANAELKLSRLRAKHQSLIYEYRDARLALAQTDLYNDSLINNLATNMALLYKINDSSEVFFVDLRYYEVDVFKGGSIILSSMGEKRMRKLDLHLIEYPEWQYINIGWELGGVYKTFTQPLRLYRDRLSNRRYHF